MIANNKNSVGTAYHLCSCEHVFDTTLYKATKLFPRYTPRELQDFLLLLDQGPPDHLCGRRVLSEEHCSEHTPPLDHEDGRVYGACLTVAGEHPLDAVTLITLDRDFRKR